MPKSHHTFSLLRMQELTPSMALELLKSGMRILTIALITVVKTVIWSSGPHQLRHRFGQHTPVLLTGFEPLLRLFLLLDVSAGAKPFQDRALSILVRRSSRQEPAIVSGRAMLDAILHFIRRAGLNGALPRSQGAFAVIGVDGLEPAVALGLLGGHVGIVTPASVTVVTRAIGAHDPDKGGVGIDQAPDVVFGLLFFMNMGAGAKPLEDLTAFIAHRQAAR